MKIAHISSHHSTGAGIGCARVHSSLIGRGLESNLITLESNETSDLPNHFQYHKLSKSYTKNLPFMGKVQKKYQRIKNQEANRDYVQKLRSLRESRIGEHYSWVSGIKSPYVDIAKLPIIKNADIIQIHWAADFLDWDSFFKEVGSEKPIVWMLCDCHPFSFGAHYNIDSPISHEMFPELSRIQLDDTLDFFKSVRLEKKKIFDKYNPNLTIVCLSDWLKELSVSSSLFECYPHFVIPSSLNTSLFKPLDTPSGPNNSFADKKDVTLIFVATRVNEKRKGLHILLEALTALDSNQNIKLLLVGDIDGCIEFPPNIELIHVGVVKNKELLNLLYNLADGCLIPSIEDNLPGVFMESLSCGTPVIGTPVGGIKETLEKYSHAGVLCSDFTSIELKNGIELFLSNVEKYNRARIRETAISLYTPDRQADDYIALYNSLLSK